ncbi:MAG: HDOD domain-containing protein [Pirellulaceae bacterium]
MRLQDYVDANSRMPAMEEIVSRMQEISSLPHVVAKTIAIANDPNSSTLDLKNVIETDAALTARILRCVNSSAYSLRQNITNLMHAVSYLGTKEIRRLALTASVAELFQQDEAIGPYRRSVLWKHMIVVGLCARLIALRQKMADFEDAFMAGILHDIGIVLEDQYAHEHFRAVVHALDNNTTLAETEQVHLGFDHAQLGARLAEVWRFPESVRAAIGFHHMSAQYHGEAEAIVWCVEAANVICTVKGYSSVGLKLVQVPRHALAALSLTREHLAVLAEDLDKEVANNESLLNL